MDLELKECWFLIVILLVGVLFIGVGVGQYQEAYSSMQNYSLGYAECKAGMKHKFQIISKE